MILISHRGNTTGPNPYFENKIGYIESTIKSGFNVEIDIFIHNDRIYLGHDYPEILVTLRWLEANIDNLWIHCKNLRALEYFLGSNFRYFWHQNDDFALTSNGLIWTHDYHEVCNNSIMVCKTIDEQSYYKNKCYGICSDYVGL